jgi:hypothetical protein
MREIKKTKSGQESKSLLSRKSGQEEMVGFGLIVILVAIIFIVFITIYIRKPAEKTSDYEVNSFIQSVLQYTTTCEEDNLENLTVQKLIIKCQENDPCDYRNMNSCLVLNSTLRNIIRESWGDVGIEGKIRGYSFTINMSEGIDEEEQEFLNIKSGVVTNDYRGSGQTLPNGGGYIHILFYVYN